ncbi:poly [ADP-ribose] polymerase [Bombyx mandarina]|uniref:Poly [ADP-ribose] polymerase n=1 Tax=Bombyx mandarina TaxID=7092 RepID=A0A6J2K7Y4_BOMMA|nr:poly [ADP-ribose] polymerase [Bombyx mandarina]
MADLPYQVEYAKTGRAACKGCKQKIDQGSLRIAVMVQSAFFDGKQPNWHHEDCFFKKRRLNSFTEIANFNVLKNEDQKRIKTTIENSAGAVVMPIQETKTKGKGKRNKRAAPESDNSALKDFKVEYSKSSRATCPECEIKICKDEIRICKILYDTEVGMKYGGQPRWHHLPCFVKCRNELLYFAGGENLPGFDDLKKADQIIVKTEIKPLESPDIPIKKLKNEVKDEKELKEDKALENKIEKQNKLFDKHRNALMNTNKKDVEKILEYNLQGIPTGKTECFDRLADCMTFGALETCPECKHGQLVVDTLGYKCTGNLSEWTKCTYQTDKPKRRALKIPENYKGLDCFRSFKPTVRTRLFHAPLPSQNFVVKQEETEVKKEIRVPPLKNLKFFIYGTLKKNEKENIKNRIIKLGGDPVSKLSEATVAVISTKADVDKMSPKMQSIQYLDIVVLDESFLNSIDPETGTVARSLELMKEYNIADWGVDPASKLPQDIIDGKSIPKSKSMYVKSEKSAVKLKIRDGNAVDPASELDEECHVYTDRYKTTYSVVLSLADVVAQKNSFYKLQILKHNKENRYWLFRSWGRIGTTIGGSKVEKMKDLDNALDRFQALYEEKTENRWKDRNNFVKIPGRYFPLEIDYGDNETKTLTVDPKCELAEPVQRLIVTIFDIHYMKQTLLEFELDTEKMPLGKLSKKQIKAGYKVLSELQNLIKSGDASRNKIVDATNRFFTLIPHDFGVNNAPLLDNNEIIKTKTDMMDNLLEIEIAYGLLQSDTDDTVSPIEGHYKKLKAEIAPLDKTTDEFEMILEYVRNTHGKTHNFYTLNVEEVFKVIREGEDKRYKPFKKLHNRRLLWHGSRTTNFAGIISQGLRIAPPEAPVTGYMFGKGIYFADMVSKSANYCCTTRNNPVGLMLLCEVALGNMKECVNAEGFSKAPSGTHSVWGVGRTEPDPKMNKELPDGLIVPLGTPVDRAENSTLLYNEFIVYDVAQVKVKYLIEMRFDYR